MSNARRSAVALLVACLFAALPVAAAAPHSIGVAPFAGAGAAQDSALAGLLARELEALSSGRVVAPDVLQVAPAAVPEPPARDVRRCAEANDLDDLVVGSVARDGRRATVELRSGHSGAARAEYVLEPDGAGPLDGAVERLARLILADLGEPTRAPADGLPEVSAAAVGADARPPAPPAAAAPPEADESLSLLPGVSRDDPISINSEELEVLPQGKGRRLVFSRNVEVRQGDITLEADRLEAVYPEGASQPDTLQASGDVRIAQGERRGRCEEATYERVANTIVCRGRAQVTQGCDEVRGESIEFDLGRERVRVVGAASVVIQPEGDDAACGRAEGNSP